MTGVEECLAVVRALGGELGIAEVPVPQPVPGAADPLPAVLEQLRVRYLPVAVSPGMAVPVLPVVAFTADGRPVGISSRGRRVRLFDPLVGRRVSPTHRDAPVLRGDGYQLYRPFPEGSLDLAGMLRFALAGSRPQLARLILFGSLAGLLTTAISISAGTFLPTLIRAGEHPFAWAGMLLGAAVVTLALAVFVRDAAVIAVQGRMQAALEPAAWDHLLTRDAALFRQFGTGELVTRTNAVAQARRLLSEALVSAALGAFFGIVGLGLLVAVDPSLAGLLMAGVSACIGALGLAARRRQRCESVVFRLQGEVNGLLYQLLLGMDKLRSAGREAQAYLLWARPFLTQKRFDAAAMRADAFGGGLTTALAPLLLGILLLGSVLLGLNLDAGHLVAAAVAAGQLALALGQVTQAATLAYGVGPALEQLAPILRAPRETLATGRDPGPLSGSLALVDVTFRYPGSAEPALQGVTLRAEPGEMVAIVGASGAGKSTVMRLLLGFERPDSGTVCYDGKALGTVDVRAVRRQIGTVLQNGNVLRGSVLDTIRGAREDVTPEEAWAAAGLVGIAEDLARLPLGLSTRVGEGGTGFSGGQVQRLRLARALVRRPRILLLDEATSALDNATQRLITDRISGLSCTRLVIAHRLSTVRRADRIYLLASGRVLATGTYDDLLRNVPEFARLVKIQES